MQEDLFHSTRKLTRLRAPTPAPRRGILMGLLVEDDAYVFARVTGGSRVVVVLHGAGVKAELHVPLEASGIATGTRLENLLGTTPAVEARQALRRSSYRPTPPPSIGERPPATVPAV